MKALKILFVIPILLCIFQLCPAQESKNLEPFDSFGEITCEEVLSRLDNFFVAIRNDPTSTGYAVINGKKDNLKHSLRYRSMIRGNVRFRRFPADRLTIIRGAETENFNVQLWLIPAGESLPVTSNLDWDDSISVSKPFIIYSEYDDGFICPSDALITFSEILTSKSDVRGHIVINTRSLKAFNERKKELLEDLNEIPADRLRFFHVRNSRENYVEYWLVPQKKLN